VPGLASLSTSQKSIFYLTKINYNTWIKKRQGLVKFLVFMDLNILLYFLSRGIVQIFANVLKCPGAV